MRIVPPPHFSSYLRDLHASQQRGELSEQRWDVIAKRHHFRDGRGFLKEFLGGTEWRGDAEPWTTLRFEETGAIAHAPKSGATVELNEPSVDALGFIGRWRPKDIDGPQDVVIHYDPSAAQVLEIKWGKALEHSSTLRRQ